MTRSTLTAGTRGLVVAGIIGAAAVTGLATAQAAPSTGSSSVTTVAAECTSFWPSPHQVCGEIRDLYVSLGGAQSALSFPSGPEVTNPDGSKYSTFFNGTIHWSQATGAYVA
ncbi:hypothetical protein CH275_09890 [Rhodococcus sp. 06-235-1A]|uniref:LGFP repeat-containing protein n=1 Tax=Rhodococcus sp. 06-235-1A TaxID=2022508 RepID=UPI000B9B5A99|nr:hypothetical protein [Rhodococcus sp. 06-235-1A]OZD06520.1 hypothetical protein CH275_09890 [Rhodococcus sp. 06-235-1A]